MFSQTTEYALRAAIYLADHPGDSQTAAAIASATRAPAHYISRVLQMLSDKGLVTARRGRLGGYDLARSPSLITLLDVVQAIEPIARERRETEVSELRDRLCPLHEQLDRVAESACRQLDSVTLAEVIDPPSRALGSRPPRGED